VTQTTHRNLAMLSSHTAAEGWRASGQPGQLVLAI
jgi:hypothetical protein